MRRYLQLPPMAIGTYLFRALSIGALSATLFCVRAQTAQRVFYALGTDNQSQSTRLYEVDSSTLRVLRSADAGAARSGMLTGQLDAVVMADDDVGDFTVMRVFAPDLKGMSKFSAKSKDVLCLEHTFVHPLTGMAYFSCDLGSGGHGVLILDTLHQAVVADLPHGPTLPSNWPKSVFVSRPTFAYDGNSSRLYLVGSDAVALDPQNRPIDYILASDIAKAAGFPVKFSETALTPNGFPGARLEGAIRYRLKLAVLHNSKVVLWLFSNRLRALVLYDPLKRQVLHSWTETETFTNTDAKALPRGEESRQDTLWFDLPVPSHDGSRLFAESGAGDSHGMIVFDANTLEVLRRVKSPEAPGEGGLVVGPDGRGMWYFGQSGKIYRLDDHTGDLIEEVKLPFHLISLIREP